MFIYLHELRDAHQAANPAEYAQHYDAAYVTAYNAVFEPFLAALKDSVRTGKVQLDNLDATTYPTLDVKASVLTTIRLAQVNGLKETIMVAHDHGRDQGSDDAFVDAVSTAMEQLCR